ncbi:unnamed protein product, partial [Brenthis ino]
MNDAYAFINRNLINKLLLALPPPAPPAPAPALAPHCAPDSVTSDDFITGSISYLRRNNVYLDVKAGRGGRGGPASAHRHLLLGARSRSSLFVRRVYQTVPYFRLISPRFSRVVAIVLRIRFRYFNELLGSPPIPSPPVFLFVPRPFSLTDGRFYRSMTQGVQDLCVAVLAKKHQQRLGIIHDH